MDDFKPRPRLSVPQRPTSGSPRPANPVPPKTAPLPTRPRQPLPLVPPAVPQPDRPAPAPRPLPPIEAKKPGLVLSSKKSRKWLWVVIPLVVVALLAVAAAGAFAWYGDALKAKSADETPIALKVESGAGIDQVAQELEQKGVIKSALAFSLYMKFSGKDVIKTGNYLLAPNQSVEEIVTWLNDGRVSTRRVTILPGQTIKQIRATLVADGFTEQAVDAALNKKYDHPLLADKPADATLEGYIFPETYFVTMDSSPEALVMTAFDEFQKHLVADGLREKLAARGFDVHESITLASIIAKEVTKPDDQKQVSQVFQARLAEGMMLGSDVTYHYAADQLGVERAVNIDSPYNTRIHTGLPPGPIGNFNLSALTAVAAPAPGNYLYFVAGDDGVTHFSRTFEEHQQNIREYCQKLCAEA